MACDGLVAPASSAKVRKSENVLARAIALAGVPAERAEDDQEPRVDSADRIASDLGARACVARVGGSREPAVSLAAAKRLSPRKPIA
jgi:hypothetical protein